MEKQELKTIYEAYCELEKSMAEADVINQAHQLIPGHMESAPMATKIREIRTYVITNHQNIIDELSKEEIKQIETKMKLYKCKETKLDNELAKLDNKPKEKTKKKYVRRNRKA
jgi:hypothetical protein